MALSQNGLSQNGANGNGQTPIAFSFNSCSRNIAIGISELRCTCKAQALSLRCRHPRASRPLLRIVLDFTCAHCRGGSEADCFLVCLCPCLCVEAQVQREAVSVTCSFGMALYSCHGSLEAVHGSPADGFAVNPTSACINAFHSACNTPAVGST